MTHKQALGLCAALLVDEKHNPVFLFALRTAFPEFPIDFHLRSWALEPHQIPVSDKGNTILARKKAAKMLHEWAGALEEIEDDGSD